MNLKVIIKIKNLSRAVSDINLNKNLIIDIKMKLQLNILEAQSHLISQ